MATRIRKNWLSYWQKKCEDLFADVITSYTGDGQLNDVQFICAGGKRIGANKWFLSAQSHYFEQMFEESWSFRSGPVELDHEGRVAVQVEKIEWCPEGCFKAILQYLYTDVLSLDMMKIIELCDLMLAAKYFQLTALVNKVESCFETLLNKSNFILNDPTTTTEVFTALKCAIENGLEIKIKILDKLNENWFQLANLDPTVIFTVSDGVMNALLQTENKTPADCRIFKVIFFTIWEFEHEKRSDLRAFLRLEHNALSSKELKTAERSGLLTKDQLFELCLESIIAKEKHGDEGMVCNKLLEERDDQIKEQQEKIKHQQEQIKVMRAENLELQKTKILKFSENCEKNKRKRIKTCNEDFF